MSSRRPMIRSYSGNGRSGFQNGEEVTAQGSRADGRGYLHSVRPENSLCFRSTLCSVMAQLTEETQPSFETTLKSKAVSESCNVKFTCVVTGYPVPELTWYKDDMEMDRYCGLPKYEIFRNGKTHTLHIYNCTLEDAAIYQASARNSKGIVTCSGVLEVGTMNEYQIHQRFFAKLKQKAQNKKKELEESRQQSKDNVQSPISLEPSQRKLLSPGETSGLVVDRDGLLKAQDKETVAEAGITEGALESTEPPEGTTELPNGFPVINENAKPPLTYIFETVEVVTTRQTNKGSQCKKKIKISNGEVSEKGGMSEDSGNVKEVSEGDVSLTTEEKEDSIEKEMKVGSSHHSPADKENQKQMDESDKTTQCDSVAGLESQVVASKQKDSSSTQSPLTSMFFSLRDILFGSKSKSRNEPVDSLDRTSGTKLRQDEKKPLAVPLKLSQQNKKDKTEKYEKARMETSRMKTNDKLPSKDIHVKRTTPLKVHREDPIKQGNLNVDGLKQGITVKTGTESVSNSANVKTGAESVSNTANMPCETHVAALQQLNEQKEVQVPVEETDLIPRCATPPQLQTPCAVEMDSTGGKVIATVSSPPRVDVCATHLIILEGQDSIHDTSKNHAIHNKSLSSSSDITKSKLSDHKGPEENYSNAHNIREQEKKDLQNTEEKDDLKDNIKPLELTSVFMEKKDEVKEKENTVGLNQQNETQRILQIKAGGECGNMPVKSLSCVKLMKKVPEVKILEEGITETKELYMEPPNKEGVAKGRETGNIEYTESHTNLKPSSKEDIGKIHETEITEPAKSKLQPPNRECSSSILVAEIKEPNDSNLEASNKEGTVRGPEARIIEQIESKLEPPNRECHARVCPPGIIELNGSNLEEHNKEAIIRVPVAGIKEPSDSNLEAFNKEGTVRDPETGIAEQIESKLEAPNKECIAKVCIPGITELNESNLEQHSKGDIVRDPVTEIKEPNDSNLEPPNKECNTRVYEPGIIELSESQLEQTNKEAIVTSSEAVIKESNESNLGLLNKEGIVKVFDAGIAEPIDSKLEPPNKECSVRVPETGTTHSIESKHKLPTNECNVRFPDSEITEPTESKEEPPNKECHVRVLDLGFSEPNESKLEISDNKGIVTVPEAGITKQLKSNLELPTKKCITPEVIEHERHVLKPHDFERKYKDDLEAPEYLVHNTYISKQSHLEESQMCPTALLGSVLSTKHAELPMAPSVGPVLSNVRDEVYLLGSESKSDLNRQNQDNTSTLEKTSSFVTETGNDFFSVQSIHIEESYKVNETESAADNKKDATTVIPTLKALTNVPGFVAPPISVTFVDSNCEKASHCKDEINEVQSLVSLLREVKNDLDTERLGVSSSLEGKKENSSFAQYTDQGPDARHPGVTDCSTVAPLGFSTSKQTSSPPMPVSAPNEFPKKTSPLVGCTEPEWSEQGCKTDCVTFIGHVQKDKSAAETVSTTIPQTPLLSPATMRRFAAKGISYLHSPGLVAVPTIQIETAMFGEKTGERQSGKDGMLPCESSPKLKRADSFTIIPSATPEELASGARRKIFISKTKGEEAESTNLGAQTRWDDMARRSRTSLDQDVAYVSPGQSRRSTSLGAPTSQQTPPLERCSPILARKKATLQVPKEYEKSEETETTSTDEKLAEKKTDPFKAPQVIRKIRGEPFSDATGHLKLWCQFFNVLSDSTIKWYRDDLSIAEMERRSGDESQVALAIVQASSRDCGVYSCTIKNEYGMDSTDFLLSADILSEFILRDDLEAGEEIEMTPMVFSKGLADSGCWGEKLFGRIVIAEVHVGEGCAHKACKVKVIYGLEPVFESGSTCVIKVRNPIAYGTREENNLLERNLEITKEECKRQNLIRQYCNIFAAEARVIENFGLPLEIIPLYLMYRPANTVPYATMEADLRGIFLRYCLIDSTGRLIMRNVSEVEQKCYTFQHWIHQFTNGNLLVTQLEGVGTKITNVRIATKSKGYQGLSDSGNPQVFQQFATQHHCNQYCGLLGLHSLKTLDSLQQPIKPKGSRSPLATRKMDSGSGSSSPQLQKKGALSPQAPKKVLSSPKMAKKSEASDSKSTSKHKTVEVPKVVRMR
ncbi:uncharacterized protein alpk3a [Scleropages formosus]|uniref:uncharacterized protein alpk3a n=1 Tax=Scleropages formosus TaxID=113540 RepID=UPI0010FABBD5|nr:uncharacterized protein LOC108941169 [Scleropages formosus]